MGGIILRCIQANDPLENIGRVVMLGPPNHGSEVVDALGHRRYFKIYNGPAGCQLGTAKDGFVESLPPVNFELGVITGDRSINPILSTKIPGKNDGKVSVESAKVEGMAEFKVMRATHTFIMVKKQVIQNVIAFLKHGSFDDTASGT